MKQLVMVPNDWPCALKDCPPGHFVYQDELCFKTEYRCSATPDNPIGKIEAYCATGEFFVGGAESESGRENIVVQPVVAEWQEVE